MNSLLSILSGIRFDNPWWLLLLPLAVGGSVAYRLLWRKNKPGVLFPSVPALRSAGFAALSLFSKFPEWLHWLVLALIVLALSGPRAPFPPSSRDTVGIDIMIALDVSASMNTPDFDGKSRFTGARDAAMRFIDNRPADRIGLVVFSGGSFTRCPLTLDHDVLERLSETVSPGFLDEPGTAIGAAAAQYKRFFAFTESLKNWKGRDGKRLFAIPIDKSSQDAEWLKLDEITMSEWMTRAGYDSPHLCWYINYCCRDDYGATMADASAWAGGCTTSPPETELARMPNRATSSPGRRGTAGLPANLPGGSKAASQLLRWSITWRITTIG